MERNKISYLIIPVEMCQYAIREKLVRPFQLYVWLNVSCSGKMKIVKRDLKPIAEALGLKSGKSIQNNLKLLLKLNWIGYDPVSQYYFIRGFEKIRAMYGFKSRTGGEFDLREIKHFKGFLAGVVIGYMVNQQKKREWASERKNWRSKHLVHHPASFYPIANRALSKVLNMSVSTAHNLKSLANKAGYILIKQNLINTGFDSCNLRFYLKALPENQPKVRCDDRKILLQEADLINPTIRFKSRKKIEQYKTGY